MNFWYVCPVHPSNHGHPRESVVMIVSQRPGWSSARRLRTVPIKRHMDAIPVNAEFANQLIHTFLLGNTCLFEFGEVTLVSLLPKDFQVHLDNHENKNRPGAGKPGLHLSSQILKMTSGNPAAFVRNQLRRTQKTNGTTLQPFLPHLVSNPVSNPIKINLERKQHG